jgi:trigger factor
VKVTVNKVDEANVLVSGTIEKGVVEANIERLAVQAGKEMKVDGFRKGKVPPHVVKKLHGDKLIQDAEADALRDLIDAGIKEAKLNAADVLGQPTFKKYDKADKGIEVEVEISTRPEFKAEGHMDVVPSFEKPTATANINFEGFVDGVAFDGGKAEKFNLKIGSNQFIPGFEEQIIGMKYEEEKTVTVTFPAEYQSADLAGKEAEFKVTLHEIQEQAAPELNDELAKKILQGEENATLDMLKEKLNEQIVSEKVAKLFNEELKPKLIEALVAKFDFALPNNIVDQEVDAKINEKARTMSEEELNGFKENPEKVDALRDEVRDDAANSVKATFIVDALAKAEEIKVEDQEVSQAIYYEAMMSGQDPQEVIKYYQDNNLLPAVKMGMIEDKLFGKMLGLDK